MVSDCWMEYPWWREDKQSEPLQINCDLIWYHTSAGISLDASSNALRWRMALGQWLISRSRWWPCIISRPSDRSVEFVPHSWSILLHKSIANPRSLSVIKLNFPWWIPYPLFCSLFSLFFFTLLVRPSFYLYAPRYIHVIVRFYFEFRL
jgi:hypothetical protein